MNKYQNINERLNELKNLNIYLWKFLLKFQNLYFYQLIYNITFFKQ